MVNLFQYFDQGKWEKYVVYLSERELDKNIHFYLKLSQLNIFPDDINKVLASLYEYSFYSDEIIFNKWMGTKIKMLDNLTPIESIENLNSSNSLREFLMRGI